MIVETEISVHLDAQLQTAVAEHAQKMGINVNELVKQVIEEFIAAQNISEFNSHLGMPDRIDISTRKLLEMVTNVQLALVRLHPELADVFHTEDLLTEQMLIFREGFAAEYPVALAPTRPDFAPQDAMTVTDTLMMFRRFYRSIAAVEKSGNTVPDKVKDLLTFRGYHLAAEPQMMSYAMWLIMKYGWDELLPADGMFEPLHRMAPAYNTLLEQCRQILGFETLPSDAGGRLFTLEEMMALLVEF